MGVRKPGARISPEQSTDQRPIRAGIAGEVGADGGDGGAVDQYVAADKITYFGVHGDHDRARQQEGAGAVDLPQGLIGAWQRGGRAGVHVVIEGRSNRFGGWGGSRRDRPGARSSASTAA